MPSVVEKFKITDILNSIKVMLSSVDRERNCQLFNFLTLQFLFLFIKFKSVIYVLTNQDR